jgi:hypothetical protein
MYCPSCGSQNADTSRFCQRCGNALPVITPVMQQPTPTPLPGMTATRSRSGWWLGLLVLVAIAVVGVTAYVVANQNSLFEAPPTPEPIAAVPDSASSQNTQPDMPTITPRPSATATPRATLTPTPTIMPSLTPTPSPTPCPDLSPYGLSTEQMKRLGCPAQGFIANRAAVIQRFEKGVMIIFAKPNNVFDNKGGGLIYALANDGRAWRMTDTFIETSADRRTWYACNVKSNDGPETTGVPWRGFGKVWCAYPDVRTALGKARSAEEGGMSASFQSYEKGRAFKVSDWRGYPGWSTRRVYLVSLPTAEGDYIAGSWEAK